MSRSYRKQPVWKDHNKGMKALANRKVRRVLNRNPNLILYGCEYKKLFETWDICDYWDIVDSNFDKYYEKEVHRWYEWRAYGLKPPFPDKKETYREWMKWYRGK